MTQHYTKSTVSAQAWCKVCHRETMHRVDNGRVSVCMDCLARREKEARERVVKAPAPKQERLF